MPTKGYQCATCGSQDRTRYVRCEHPACPDGHDQGGVYYPPAPARRLRPLTREDRRMGRVLWLVLLFFLISFVYSCTTLIDKAHMS